MTVEMAIWHVLDAGGRLEIEGDSLIVEVLDEATAARIPPEALAVLKARKDEALEIVRRMRERGPVAVRCLCAACGESFAWEAPGMDWLPCPGGGGWPRCPTCATRGRVPAPPGTPTTRPRRRGDP